MRNNDSHITNGGVGYVKRMRRKWGACCPCEFLRLIQGIVVVRESRCSEFLYNELLSSLAVLFKTEMLTFSSLQLKFPASRRTVLLLTGVLSMVSRLELS